MAIEGIFGSVKRIKQENQCRSALYFKLCIVPFFPSFQNLYCWHTKLGTTCTKDEMKSFCFSLLITWWLYFCLVILLLLLFFHYRFISIVSLFHLQANLSFVFHILPFLSNVFQPFSTIKGNPQLNLLIWHLSLVRDQRNVDHKWLKKVGNMS